ALQALLRELTAFNKGICVITTRTPVADIADHESTSAPRRELEQLFGDAGAKLLRALGVTDREAELRSASEDFGGQCLALTLLGSYLTGAYNGDVRCRNEVSARLAHDLRQGVHARKVMESYQTWLGEGPELSVLRMLGLFDRPVDERTMSAMLRTCQNFAHWLAVGVILRGWARSALGNATEGISWIEDGLRDYWSSGAIRSLPYFLSLKAEALHLANRTQEALVAIKEADALIEKYEDHNARSRLCRLRGVFLAAIDADETEIEASFCEAIRFGREQKSISLEKRAAATYAEYRSQKASASGGRGFRLPLW